MHVERYSDPAVFLERAGPWLERAEAENNLILGVAGRLATGDERLRLGFYLASVLADGEIAGCAFRTPPYPVGLTRLRAGAIPVLVDDLQAVYGELPGVSGPRDDARRFADEWARRSGGTWHIRFRMRIHRLDRVAVPESLPAGSLRLATEADAGIVTAWAAGFVRDTGIRDAAGELGERLLRAGQLYVWDDAGPRSMIASSRATPHGACISAVYTPPEHRGRGYASAAVATLSRCFLDAGKQFCCLYTDQANPTSNSIYRKVGYRPVSEAVDIDFAENAGGRRE